MYIINFFKQFFRKNKNNFVEYYEMDDFFQINGNGKYKWIKIYLPSDDINDVDYANTGYCYISDNYSFGHTAAKGNSTLERGTLSEHEYQKIKKLPSRKKRIEFLNNTVINLAWWSFVVLFLTNIDRIWHNTFKILQMLYNLLPFQLHIF